MKFSISTTATYNCTIIANSETDVNVSRTPDDVSFLAPPADILLQAEAKPAVASLGSRYFFTSLSFFWSLLSWSTVWLVAGLLLLWPAAIGGYGSLIPAPPQTTAYNVYSALLSCILAGIAVAPWLILLALLGILAKSSTYRTRLCAAVATTLYLGVFAYFLYRML